MNLLCVHAHPDDEAIWTGGLLAKHPGSTVVTCTWAEGTQRVAELERSLDILGAGKPRLLGYADRQPESSPGRPRMAEVPFEELVERVVEQIREVKPSVVVTYDAFGGYGHADHVLAHRVTLAAAEAAGYGQLFPAAGDPWRPSELWMATFPRSFVVSMFEELLGSPPEDVRTLPGTDDAVINEAVDIREWSDRKWAAMLAHESEVLRGASLTMLTSLPEPTRERFLSTEWYLRRALA